MNPTGTGHVSSLQPPAALAVAALLMLVPANLLPVLTSSTQGTARTDTIMTGIIGLWEDGLPFISAIVFIASILIPLLKLLGLGWLIVVARRRRVAHPRALTRVYAALAFIGRWSMLDV